MKNPVFKGMMNSGNCKQKIVPNKKKDDDDDIYWVEGKLSDECFKYLRDLEEKTLKEFKGDDDVK